jgi:hypothetical protein
MGSTALDRLSSVRNLTEIWNAYWPRAKRSTPGVDGITPKQFNDNLTTHLAIIRAKLRDGYTYSHLRGVSVPKKDPTKFRVICVPTIQLASPEFWPNPGSGREPERLHLIAVLSFDDEFREAVACGGIQQKFRHAVAQRIGHH